MWDILQNLTVMTFVMYIPVIHYFCIFDIIFKLKPIHTNLLNFIEM